MNNTKNDHCLSQIRTDLSTLGPVEMQHIEKCKQCKAEYEIYRRLEHAIATLPETVMPDLLRQQILANVLHPGYSLRHLLIALGFAVLSPVLLSLMKLKGFFSSGLLVGIYGGSGLLILLLLLPIVHYLISRQRIDVDVLKDRVDDLLARR